MLSESVS